MTMSENIEISRATSQDIDDIFRLLQANAADQGGMLTGRFERIAIAAALADMPVVIARGAVAGEPRRLAGVLMSAPVRAAEHNPMLAGMLAVYSGGPGAYIYGPICIDEKARGKGLAEKLLARLKQELPGREGILFIRQDNAASLRAHRDKMKMATHGSFSADGVDYLVLSYQP